MKSPVNPRLQHVILSTDADVSCCPKCDFLGGLEGALEKISRLAIARHIYGPATNYAIIRPLHFGSVRSATTTIYRIAQKMCSPILKRHLLTSLWLWALPLDGGPPLGVLPL